MTKKRTGDHRIQAPVYGASLSEFDVNLLVADAARRDRLRNDHAGGGEVYADPCFAVLRRGSSEWALHADQNV